MQEANRPRESRDWRGLMEKKPGGDLLSVSYTHLGRIPGSTQNTWSRRLGRLNNGQGREITGRGHQSAYAMFHCI